MSNIITNIYMFFLYDPLVSDNKIGKSIINQYINYIKGPNNNRRQTTDKILQLIYRVCINHILIESKYLLANRQLFP